MSLRSDALLATTGVLPKAIAFKHHAAAEALPGRWERRLKGWLERDQAEFTYVMPKDMEKLFEELAVDPPATEIEGWLRGAGVDADLEASYTPDLLRARQFLVNAWPKVTVQGPAGARIMPLSEDDRHEIWSLFQVIDDPDRVLEELDMWSLSPSQADAFRACYPDLFEFAAGMLRAAITAKVNRDKDWLPDESRDSVLREFLGMAPEQAFLPPPKPPEKPTKLKLDPSQEATQGQISSETTAQKSSGRR